MGATIIIIVVIAAEVLCWHSHSSNSGEVIPTIGITSFTVVTIIVHYHYHYHYYHYYYYYYYYY